MYAEDFTEDTKIAKSLGSHKKQILDIIARTSNKGSNKAYIFLNDLEPMLKTLNGKEWYQIIKWLEDEKFIIETGGYLDDNTRRLDFYVTITWDNKIGE